MVSTVEKRPDPKLEKGSPTEVSAPRGQGWDVQKIVGFNSLWPRGFRV